MTSLPASSRPATHTVIQPGNASPLAELRELWGHRELLALLAWRDVRVRYRQTVLGAGWALLEPLVNVGLFTLVFHRMAGIDAGPVPYPLYCYAGMLLWTFFGRSLRCAALSLVANASLITKAYFPRLVLPLAGQLATVLDLGCGLVMYLGLAMYYGGLPGPAVLTMPIWALLAGLNALGVGLVLAAVNARYRDVSQAVPLLTQVWMFATPIAYPLTAIPQRWLGLYLLNPMVGVTEGVRWALLPGYPLQAELLVPGLLTGMVLAVVGWMWFRAAQRRLADII